MTVDNEELVKARAVMLILQGKPEEAIELLSNYYNIKPPAIKIGLPKKCLKALGCYVAKTRTIHLRSSEQYTDPFVILHEFYHHLRFRLGKHRGTEKHADKYALDAIRAWQKYYARQE